MLASCIFVTACGGGSGPGDSPKETLTRLTGYIADDDGEAACELMTKATRDKFASENDAKDCEDAVSSFAGQITDEKAFRAMVPNGMKVTGDSAEVSGYCRNGWSNADGSRSKLRFNPNDLGDLTVQKTDDGWVIYDYSGTKHYSTCG